MKNFSPSVRMALFAALVSAVAALVYGGMFWWISVERAELTDLRTRVGASAKTHELIKSQQSLALETEAERNELNGYLLPVSDPGTFLELLERLGTETGVALEVTDVVVEQPPRSKRETITETATSTVHVLFTVKAAGTWTALYRLERLFELLPYALTVQRVSFVREASQEGAPWSLECVLRVATRPR